MITTVITPWEDKFYNMVSECETQIRITSPFIKSNIVTKLYDNMKENVKLDVVTSCKLMNFYKRVTDIEALSFILEKGGRLLNYQNLHSKIYIFDDKKAIITSSNLTKGGLHTNYEYGIELDEQNLVKRIINDFNILAEDEKTGIVELTELSKINEIINALPKESRIIIPKINSNEDEKDFEIFTGDINIVEAKLRGWSKDVFRCMLKMQSKEFSLSDIYGFEEKLNKIHPKNKFIKDKIRQQLQKLRDIGLIQFLGNGNYKKLWK